MDTNNTKKELECKFHRMLMFYIPFLYAIESRFLRRSKLGVLVWGTEYLIPVLLAMYLANQEAFFTIQTLLSLVGVYNFYEIGYIQNDCETIKKEKHPTLRISPFGLACYEKYKFLIYEIRLVIGMFLSCIFIYWNVSYVIILSFWSIIPIYMIYNKIRGRINLYFIAVLTTYRYCMPLLLFTSTYDSNWEISFGILFLSYPIIKLIEICAGGKGLPQERWTKFFMSHYNKRFSFRIKYYIILSIGTCLFLVHLETSIQSCIIPFYFFLLRLGQLNMPKLGAR